MGGGTLVFALLQSLLVNEEHGQIYFTNNFNFFITSCSFCYNSNRAIVVNPLLAACSSIFLEVHTFYRQILVYDGQGFFDVQFHK